MCSPISTKYNLFFLTIAAKYTAATLLVSLLLTSAQMPLPYVQAEEPVITATSIHEYLESLRYSQQPQEGYYRIKGIEGNNVTLEHFLTPDIANMWGHGNFSRTVTTEDRTLGHTASYAMTQTASKQHGIYLRTSSNGYKFYQTMLWHNNQLYAPHDAWQQRSNKSTTPDTTIDLTGQGRAIPSNLEAPYLMDIQNDQQGTIIFSSPEDSTTFQITGWAAMNSTVMGTVKVLHPGGIFEGEFTLPVKSPMGDAGMRPVYMIAADSTVKDYGVIRMQGSAFLGGEWGVREETGGPIEPTVSDEILEIISQNKGGGTGGDGGDDDASDNGNDSSDDQSDNSDNDDAITPLSVQPIAHWLMDTVDATIPDAVRDYDLANNGVTTIESNGESSALRFDRAGNFLTNTELNLAHDFTIASWVNFDAGQSGPHTIAAQYDVYTPNKKALLFQVHTSGNEIFFYTSADGNAVTLARQPITPTPGTWQHLVAAYGNGSIQFYLDGQPLGGAHPATSTIHSAADQFRIGAWSTKKHDQFSGLMDDVMIFDVPLSADDVATLYANGPTPIGGGTGGDGGDGSDNSDDQTDDGTGDDQGDTDADPTPPTSSIIPLTSDYWQTTEGIPTYHEDESVTLPSAVTIKSIPTYELPSDGTAQRVEMDFTLTPGNTQLHAHLDHVNGTRLRVFLKAGYTETTLYQGGSRTSHSASNPVQANVPATLVMEQSVQGVTIEIFPQNDPDNRLTQTYTNLKSPTGTYHVTLRGADSNVHVTEVRDGNPEVTPWDFGDLPDPNAGGGGVVFCPEDAVLCEDFSDEDVMREEWLTALIDGNMHVANEKMVMGARDLLFTRKQFRPTAEQAVMLKYTVNLVHTDTIYAITRSSMQRDVNGYMSDHEVRVLVSSNGANSTLEIASVQNGQYSVKNKLENITIPADTDIDVTVVDDGTTVTVQVPLINQSLSANIPSTQQAHHIGFSNWHRPSTLDDIEVYYGGEIVLEDFSDPDDPNPLDLSIELDVEDIHITYSSDTSVRARVLRSAHSKPEYRDLFTVNGSEGDNQTLTVNAGRWWRWEHGHRPVVIETMAGEELARFIARWNSDKWIFNEAETEFLDEKLTQDYRDYSDSDIEPQIKFIASKGENVLLFVQSPADTSYVQYGGGRLATRTMRHKDGTYAKSVILNSHHRNDTVNLFDHYKGTLLDSFDLAWDEDTQSLQPVDPARRWTYELSADHMPDIDPDVLEYIYKLANLDFRNSPLKQLEQSRLYHDSPFFIHANFIKHLAARYNGHWFPEITKYPGLSSDDAIGRAIEEELAGSSEEYKRKERGRRWDIYTKERSVALGLAQKALSTYQNMIGEALFAGLTFYRHIQSGTHSEHEAMEKFKNTMHVLRIGKTHTEIAIDFQLYMPQENDILRVAREFHFEQLEGRFFNLDKVARISTLQRLCKEDPDFLAKNAHICGNLVGDGGGSDDTDGMITLADGRKITLERLNNILRKLARCEHLNVAELEDLIQFKLNNPKGRTYAQIRADILQELEECDSDEANERAMNRGLFYAQKVLEEKTGYDAQVVSVEESFIDRGNRIKVNHDNEIVRLFLTEDEILTIGRIARDERTTEEYVLRFAHELVDNEIIQEDGGGLRYVLEKKTSNGTTISLSRTEMGAWILEREESSLAYTSALVAYAGDGSSLLAQMSSSSFDQVDEFVIGEEQLTFFKDKTITFHWDGKFEDWSASEKEASDELVEAFVDYVSDVSMFIPLGAAKDIENILLEIYKDEINVNEAQIEILEKIGELISYPDSMGEIMSYLLSLPQEQIENFLIWYDDYLLEEISDLENENYWLYHEQLAAEKIFNEVRIMHPNYFEENQNHPRQIFEDRFGMPSKIQELKNKRALIQSVGAGIFAADYQEKCTVTGTLGSIPLNFAPFIPTAMGRGKLYRELYDFNLNEAVTLISKGSIDEVVSLVKLPAKQQSVIYGLLAVAEVSNCLAKQQ